MWVYFGGELVDLLRPLHSWVDQVRKHTTERTVPETSAASVPPAHTRLANVCLEGTWAGRTVTTLFTKAVNEPSYHMFTRKTQPHYIYIYIYIYMKREVFYMALANCRYRFRPYFGPHQYSVNQL